MAMITRNTATRLPLLLQSQRAAAAASVSHLHTLLPSLSPSTSLTSYTRPGPHFTSAPPPGLSKKAEFLISKKQNFTYASRCFSTVGDSIQSIPQGSAESASYVPQRIKFKRLDKTAKHIMQIVDKEAVEEVRTLREIPEIKPGYIVQLKVEVPENKRRVSIVKGIVIARRNAGLNSTFRIRRLVAGVGVESMFPLYSPNLREIKVVDKKRVRRAKLYYLRDKMNALKNNKTLINHSTIVLNIPPSKGEDLA